MAVHTSKKGVYWNDGTPPDQVIVGEVFPRHVGIDAADYVGLTADVLVGSGESVKRGQALFVDKDNPGLRVTAPSTGTIQSINYDDSGQFQSIMIELDVSERAGDEAQISFESYTGNAPAGLSRDDIKALLVESGLWISLRTRPFGLVPSPADTPYAVFITATDTDPFAPNPELAIKGHENDFERGLVCVAKLTEGRVYLCKARGAAIPANPNTGIQIEEFEGPHPAGTVGVHINALSPASAAKIVWHVNYQDVLAIGKLFGSGKLYPETVVAIAGPSVNKPQIVRTLRGAAIDELLSGNVTSGNSRIISGSTFSGRVVDDAHGYLGRYHHQVCAFPQSQNGTSPYVGLRGMHALVHALDARIFHGALPLLSLEACRGVSPISVITPALLRALIKGDAPRAERLGVLELDEEDVALCSLITSRRYDFPRLLRVTLDRLRAQYESNRDQTTEPAARNAGKH